LAPSRGDIAILSLLTPSSPSFPSPHSQLRAKYIRSYVDKMITLSKENTLHSKRQMEAFIYDKDLVKAVCEEAPKRYAER
jgi:hypothetical protein